MTFMDDSSPLWEKEHKQALLKGESVYIDPQTGYRVMTEIGHQKRGHCCLSNPRCRHCPWVEKFSIKETKMIDPISLI